LRYLIQYINFLLELQVVFEALDEAVPELVEFVVAVFQIAGLIEETPRVFSL